MQRLVTTIEASEILGISLQGIHYRIKKNQLKSVKKDGKVFVYIDEALFQTVSQEQSGYQNSFDRLIESKDEQIHLLKKSIKWMRNQYIDEINRLENNQKRVIEVFNSEIKLLQSAFNEMKALYNRPQLEIKKQEDENIVKKDEFITIKDFFLIMKSANKSELEIKSIIFEAIKNKDRRFIYNKAEKRLLILNSDFKDLMK